MYDAKKIICRAGPLECLFVWLVGWSVGPNFEETHKAFLLVLIKNGVTLYSREPLVGRGGAYSRGRDYQSVCRLMVFMYLGVGWLVGRSVGRSVGKCQSVS